MIQLIYMIVFKIIRFYLLFCLSDLQILRVWIMLGPVILMSKPNSITL
jgi:hypothetical protein